ncbi:MAG: TOBE domain-containing protein [Sulfurospirillum sp.]|nr:TOBE domain-containing protein [Sulfurospirillum sp.]
MNKIKGVIKKITSHQGISLVNIQILDTLFGTVLLDTPKSCNYLKIGKGITVVFKETEVVIALLNMGGISMTNQLKCKIKSIQNGKILSKIELTCKETILTSFITLNSSKRLNLKVNDNVMALIKANEISLIEED